MCVYVVCLVNVQAEQSKLSRNSWSSKISQESANGCKIYSTLACAASGSVKKTEKKKKSWLFFRKEPRSDRSSVYEVVRVCVRAAVLPEQGSTAVLGGPSNDQLLLPVHVLPGQTVATAVQGPGHVKGLVIEKKRT